MELVVSVTFLCCGNVENQVSLFLSNFRHVSWTEISRHVSVSRFPLLFVSVTFLQTDFQFVCYNKNNFYRISSNKRRPE